MSSKETAEKHVDEDINDDDDDDEKSENNETGVDIGIINENEKITQTRFILHSSTFYPCKLGGKPQWLDFNNLKALNENLNCKNCKIRLSFLLQIYAPLNQNNKEDNDPAFHRYLYLFLCSNSNCSNRTFKAYRSQMARKNDFYSSEAPPVANSLDLTESTNIENLNEKIKTYLFDFYLNIFKKNSHNLCNICGYLSTKMCSKCKFIYYCSESHQKLDWTFYKHKNICKNYCNATSLEEKVKIFLENELDKEISNENTIFPEHEILIEPEILDLDPESNEIDQNKIDEQLKLNEHLSRDLENLPENEHDKEFELFKARIRNEPRQVIRYDRNGKPLWSTNKSKLIKDDCVPKCENCNSKRVFEFQVMPQLLTYLKLNEDIKSNDTIDWASLYIYTCENNCISTSSDTSSYIEEFIYKQDF